MRLSFISPALVILMTASSAFANREEPIISAQTGGQPYLLVLKDSTKKSKREPGIYVRNQDTGDWTLLFPGAVLVDKQRGASTNMLKLQEVDNRMPIMAVIDGQIRIWSLMSTAADSKSFIALGPEPITDIGSGTRWELPAITSADQLAVAQFLTPDRKAMLLLVSIKNPSPSQIAQSDGLTIALTLEAGDGKALALRKDRAFVIDQKFRPVQQLNDLAKVDAEHGLTIFSESLEQATLNQWDMMDYHDYNTKVRNLVSGKRYALLMNAPFFKPTVARWSVDKQKAIYDDLLQFDLETITGAHLMQRWNLLSGNPEVDITDPKIASQFLIQLNGRLRVDTNGEVWTVLDTESKSSVFAIEQDFFIATRIKDYKRHLKLGKFRPNAKIPDRSSLLVFERDGRVYVLMSYGYLREGISAIAVPPPEYFRAGRTELYVFTSQDGPELHFERSMSLSDAFYDSNELRARVIEEVDDKASLIIDVKTPPMGGAPHYHQAHKGTSPYLDLLRSTDGIKRFVYTVPIHSERLTNNLIYREFEFSDGKNPNGIYEINDSGEAVAFTSGELLQRQGFEGFEILGRSAPYQSETLGSFTASGFFIDPTFREGKHGFQTLLDLRGTKDTTAWRASVIIASNTADLHSNIVDLRLLNGTRKHASDMWMLQFYPNTVWIGTFSIVKSDKGLTASAVKGITQKYDGDPQKFMERVVYSSNGDPYLIETPEISPDSREFQMRSLRTGQSIFPKRLYGNDAITFDFNINAGDLFQSFNENSAFSWKVQPFRQLEEKRNGSVAALVKNQLFAKFSQYLSEAADPQQPKRRRILIVPDELKALADDFVRESYLIPQRKDAPKDSLFHRFNRKLGLYLFNRDQATPDAVFENFEMAARKKDEASVIVASLEDLIEVNRPVTDDDNTFLLKIPESVSDDEGQARMYFEEITPHIFYLMAAGAPVEFEEFRKKAPAPRATTLLIGTRDELVQLQEDAASEMAAGLVDAFEVIELPQPTLDSKAAILEEVMNRPEIKGLGFDYDASEILEMPSESKDEQRRKLFEYAITRIDALTAERGKNSYSKFAEFETLYRERIISDPIVRTTRLIDRAFIERILKTQFNLALNLADLPENDHRKILSRADAIIRLHRSGMLGEFELKAQLIRVILSQMTHDPARNIAASLIFAGEPGTGKSQAWWALVEALDLKLYKPGLKNNDANAFYLDTVNVKKGDPEARKRVLRELNEFVTSEKGSTGFIFIDDLSFADDDLGKDIVQWIRALQQAEGGVYRYTNEEKSTFSVSVRNLFIGLAMNFTDNKSTLSQYSGDDVNGLVSKIVATGSRYGMDKSFVDRFGAVFNFDKFHQSVKEPALNNALLNGAQSKMTRAGQYVVADPELVREASKAFPDLGARPFLSKVTEAILSQPDQLQGSRSKIFAIIPKTQEERALAENVGTAVTTGAWGEQSSEVKAWVNKNARVIEIDQSQTAALMLMRLMVPSFRSPIIESLVFAIQTDPRYNSDRLAQNYFLSPALLAVVDHMNRAETIPLKDIKMDESLFGIKTREDREEFGKLLEEMSVGQTPFVVPLGESRDRLSLWAELGVNGTRANPMNSRNSVIRTYRGKIEELLEKHLLRTLNVHDLSVLDNPEDWLRGLPEKVPDHTDELGRELNNLLFAFAREFQASDLREAMGENSPKLDPYVSARFFLMTLDQAISRLPWTRLSQKMMVALEAATHDLVLGQSVSVKNWLFNPKDRVSLLKPVTTNLIREIVEFNSSVREVSQDERSRKDTAFTTNCEKYLDKGTQ
ncbi:MAG: hypothetical protein KF799_11685 [Bdellovibrionales bacterium]|nr:hypothetical protein [Bdellovibrionales bacterium]